MTDLYTKYKTAEAKEYIYRGNTDKSSDYKQTGKHYKQIPDEKWITRIDEAVEVAKMLAEFHAPLCQLKQDNVRKNRYNQQEDLYWKKTIVNKYFDVEWKEEKEIVRPDFVESQIYIVINHTNNKAYVGQTLTYHSSGDKQYIPYGFEGRHARRITDSLICKDHMSRAIRANGAEAFEVYLITTCSTLEADFYETFFITCFDLCNENIGYNILQGGKTYFAMGSKPASSWVPNGDVISAAKSAKRAQIDAKEEYKHVVEKIDDIIRINISTEKALKDVQLRLEFFGEKSDKKVCKSINFGLHDYNRTDVFTKAKNIILALLNIKKLILYFKQDELRDSLAIDETLYIKHQKFKNLKKRVYSKELKQKVLNEKKDQAKKYAEEVSTQIKLHKRDQGGRTDMIFGIGRNRKSISFSNVVLTENEILDCIAEIINWFADNDVDINLEMDAYHKAKLEMIS